MAYPSAEWGGFVWIYMGPPDKQPPLPNYHWCTLPDAEPEPDAQVDAGVELPQGVEGDLDSAHVSFLHRKFGQDDRPINYGAPRLTTMETDFGFVYGARRPADDDYFWRVTTFTLPMFVKIPGGHVRRRRPLHPAHGRRAQLVVRRRAAAAARWPAGAGAGPADAWATPIRPLDPTNAFIPGTWRRVRNKDNDYLIDRQRQRTLNYTGLPGNRVEDAAMTESMGPIYDRTAGAPRHHRRRDHLLAPHDDAPGAQPGERHRACHPGRPQQLPRPPAPDDERRG